MASLKNLIDEDKHINYWYLEYRLTKNQKFLAVVSNVSLEYPLYLSIYKEISPDNYELKKYYRVKWGK